MRGSAAFRVSVAPGGGLAPSWVRDPLSRNAGANPSLDLRFADSKSLVDSSTGANLVTFTRASSGTYVGSDGLIKTATTNEARFDHNPTTGESLGLLVEEQRTNLLLRSEEFETTWSVLGTVTANAITAPNGTVTADLITTNGANAQPFQGVTVSSGATITGSCFLKPNGINETEIVLLSNNNTTPYARATFNIATGVVSVAATTANGGTNASANIQAFANGWYRCSVTVTYPAVTLAGIRINAPGATGGIYIWGAQLEAGSFPTSYIPTTTATVTRSADVASITGANFSSWYNQTEGTVFADFLRVYSGNFPNFPNLYQFNDGTDNNEITLFGVQSGQFVQPSIRVGGSGQIDFTGFTSTFPGPNRSAHGFSLNNSTFAANGALTTPDTTVNLPTVNQVNFGARSGQRFTGTIRRLTYWPSRLPNATLQQITR